MGYYYYLHPVVHNLCVFINPRFDTRWVQLIFIFTMFLLLIFDFLYLVLFYYTNTNKSSKKAKENI